MSEAIRIGAAANQAAQVLSGIWRAIADGSITTADVVTMHGDLTADFVRNMDTLETAGGLATQMGAVAATPEEASGFPPVPSFIQPAEMAPVAPVAPVQAVPAVAAAPAPVQGFATVQAAPGAAGPVTTTQVAPMPGVALTEDQKWQKFFADPSAFYDNRQDKINGQTAQGRPVKPSSPDFKHKTEDMALWLTGKYPAPEWVQQQFAAL